MEIWEDIEGYEGFYKISNVGNVHSLDRFGRNGKNSMMLYRGKPIKARKHNGYFIVDLHRDNKAKTHFIHRLVASAFIKRGGIVNHKDGNKLNNTTENLEVGSHRDNMRHAFATGLISHKGVKNSQSKLTPEDVRHIRKLHGDGQTIVNISKDYDVSSEAIRKVVRRLSWVEIA